MACWDLAAKSGQWDLSAVQCCEFQAGRGGMRCLDKDYATTCSFPDVQFRRPDSRDVANTKGKWNIVDPHRDPIVRLSRYPTNRRFLEASVTLFLTLGVGAYALAAEALKQQAMDLNVFTKVHSHTNFDFATKHEMRVFAKHLDAWTTRRAPIAGFGWWKPVICRHHLQSAELPLTKGTLVFSDAGSFLEPVSRPPWTALLEAMRLYDVMAVLDPNFIERAYTKQITLKRFELSLHGTQAFDEGQFVTTLFAVRKTSAALRLIGVWEELVSDIRLVDETLSPNGENPAFVAHRHEQSVWSLLLKCAIHGRSILMDDGALVNVSARVLIISKEYEVFQLIDFRRIPRNPLYIMRNNLSQWV